MMTWPLTALMAPLIEDGLNTDVIYPARFLLVLERKNLGQYAFADLRKQRADFVLDAPEYSGAGILLTGREFGSGSSREHAVWTLQDAGIQALIGLGFGDIFYRNCIENGILPAVIGAGDLVTLEAHARAGQAAIVDLEAGEIRVGEHVIAFPIAAADKQRLLSGQSVIERIEAKAADRDAFIRNRAYAF
jgi:3-isopropylmalate/(R)-2-methylmalate dehydratase small subunit